MGDKIKCDKCGEALTIIEDKCKYCGEDHSFEVFASRYDGLRQKFDMLNNRFVIYKMEMTDGEWVEHIIFTLSLSG